jgi:YVTN family beta-propeller protein
MRRWLLLALLGCGGPEPPVATASAPLAWSADGASLWVVAPDADLVTRLDVRSGEARERVAVGDEPWSVAVSGEDVLVVNRGDGTVSFVGGGALAVGAEPAGIVVVGRRAYVAVSGEDVVAEIDLDARAVVARIPVGRRPWAIAVVGEQLWVTHRLARLRAGAVEGTDQGKEGWLTVIDGNGVREIAVPPYDFGHANVLDGIAVSGEAVHLAHQLAAPDLPRDFEHSVSGALTSLAGDRAATLHLNDGDFSTPTSAPCALAINADGTRAYVVLAGTDAVMGVDLVGRRLLGFWPTGRNPRGIVLDRSGTRAYVMNALSRDVSVLALDETVARPELARIVVAPETLAPAILRGKILFHKANDPRLSHLGWMSCASCHPDGGTDGITWRMADGPRQTQPLWALAGTAPFHASGTRDEVQDFEVDIEGIMDGLGLAPGVAGPELGPPAAGRSADLDALAAFVMEGIRPPRTPGRDPARVARGERRFLEAGCAGCHDAAARQRHDVGTLAGDDVLGAEGFDTPSLTGLATSAPYLHDGSAATLNEAVRHGGVPLDDDLRAYLESR